MDIDMGYEYLKRYVQDEFGIDLSAYKDNQIKRRLETLLTRAKTTDYHQYVHRLKKDEAERARLLRVLTVNTSEFYRDPAVFDLLRDEILPELLKARRRLRIWSAGCSDGPEPYTIAMILDALEVPPHRFELYATDIDEEVLLRAREGRYPEQRLAKLPPGWRERYFQQVERTFAVAEGIKRVVAFKRHDLLGKPLPGPWEIILCRNVLIYLNREAQDGLIAKFASLLGDGGYLILGWPEYIFQPERLGLSKVGPCTYRKKEGGERDA